SWFSIVMSSPGADSIRAYVLPDVFLEPALCRFLFGFLSAAEEEPICAGRSGGLWQRPPTPGTNRLSSSGLCRGRPYKPARRPFIFVASRNRKPSEAGCLQAGVGGRRGLTKG